jgi:exosome complex RNA-binding protein Rrp4
VNTTDGSIVLSWSDNCSSETAYRVEWDSDGNGDYTRITDVIPNSTGYTHRSSNFQFGDIYNYRVCTVDAQGQASRYVYAEDVEYINPGQIPASPSNLNSGFYYEGNEVYSTFRWNDNSNDENVFKMVFDKYSSGWGKLG